MTFAKFQKLFIAKYPDGWVHPHGKYGGCEKNMKADESLWLKECAWFLY